MSSGSGPDSMLFSNGKVRHEGWDLELGAKQQNVGVQCGGRGTVMEPAEPDAAHEPRA